jgi:hypothetical protein
MAGQAFVVFTVGAGSVSLCADDAGDLTPMRVRRSAGGRRIASGTARRRTTVPIPAYETVPSPAERSHVPGSRPRARQEAAGDRLCVPPPVPRRRVSNLSGHDS